ncbi:MAG: MazG family protein [Treponemataceae bacterium]|nr:MazG family protein [Treponemataceae bacterium]
MQKEGMTDGSQAAAASCSRFFDVIRTLRAPGGCPWDREQTPLSLRRDLIEEVFEAAAAISDGDAAHAKEELGDVLLNAVMAAYIYEQNGYFSVADVIDGVAEKIVRRHPHVFPESAGAACMTEAPASSEAVLRQWDAIKETVEGRQGGNSVLDDVPKGFPPLARACKLQKKAAKRGFDWDGADMVAEKVLEEVGEIRQAVSERDALSPAPGADGGPRKPFSAGAPAELDAAQLHVEEEVGDLLFAVVNYARHLGVDPEVALCRTNEKFCRRFSYVERRMKESEIPFDHAHLADEDRFWDEAKKSGL